MNGCISNRDKLTQTLATMALGLALSACSPGTSSTANEDGNHQTAAGVTATVPAELEAALKGVDDLQKIHDASYGMDTVDSIDPDMKLLLTEALAKCQIEYYSSFDSAPLTEGVTFILNASRKFVSKGLAHCPFRVAYLFSITNMGSTSKTEGKMSFEVIDPALAAVMDVTKHECTITKGYEKNYVDGALTKHTDLSSVNCETTSKTAGLLTFSASLDYAYIQNDQTDIRRSDLKIKTSLRGKIYEFDFSTLTNFKNSGSTTASIQMNGIPVSADWAKLLRLTP